MKVIKMKLEEIKGNIWNYYDKGNQIVILMSYSRAKNGEVIMNKGIALQAKQKFPSLPRELSTTLSIYGDHLICDSSRKIIFFPIKYSQQEKTDLSLIKKGAQELLDLFNKHIKDYPTPIYITKSEDEENELPWKNIKNILEKYLDDRFVIVEGKVISRNKKDVLA